ncbi:hypothetical protein BB31_25235 [Amycolatopsis lurida NRRL 2430]|uniref:Uncharacterized protein n=1 Tax=Amycolatopsis lurida NRRL 2430 TaxID=1460371 RepID=A0A2P2FP30_AMYLU|nr:hypothetical protein BB31_25235 [Amycolatopsis lurida NRRL 2430]
MRSALGLLFGWSSARDPRRVSRRLVSSSNIHFAIKGSWTGLGDHTHLKGSLTLPRLDVVARRLKTW